MSHFAGENMGLGGQWSNAYQRLLTGRQEYAKRTVRLAPAIGGRAEGFDPVSAGNRGNVIIPVDFGGSSPLVANRLLRQAIRSTEDLRSALFWIGISTAAVLALGFLGA